MAAVMTNLKISQDKVQIAMARKAINPYDLCSLVYIMQIFTIQKCKVFSKYKEAL